MNVSIDGHADCTIQQNWSPSVRRLCSAGQIKTLNATCFRIISTYSHWFWELVPFALHTPFIRIENIQFISSTTNYGSLAVAFFSVFLLLVNVVLLFTDKFDSKSVFCGGWMCVTPIINSHWQFIWLPHFAQRYYRLLHNAELIRFQGCWQKMQSYSTQEWKITNYKLHLWKWVLFMFLEEVTLLPETPICMEYYNLQRLEMQ